MSEPVFFFPFQKLREEKIEKKKDITSSDYKEYEVNGKIEKKRMKKCGLLRKAWGTFIFLYVTEKRKEKIEKLSRSRIIRRREKIIEKKYGNTD